MHSKCKALRMLVALDDCITLFMKLFPKYWCYLGQRFIIYSLTKFGAFSNCELHNWYWFIWVSWGFTVKLTGDSVQYFYHFTHIMPYRILEIIVKYSHYQNMWKQYITMVTRGGMFNLKIELVRDHQLWNQSSECTYVFVLCVWFLLHWSLHIQVKSIHSKTLKLMQCNCCNLLLICICTGVCFI